MVQGSGPGQRAPAPAYPTVLGGWPNNPPQAPQPEEIDDSIPYVPLDPAHPLQVACRAAVDELAGPVLGASVDGCGAPAFVTPLAGLARLAHALARPTDPAVARVAAAMQARPDLVAGTDRLDTVWIHDPAVDFHGDAWHDVFDIAMSGAARALTRLRDEKVIQGWGLGVNRVEPCELALERADPDGFLLAGRYTLLDHAGALERLMPESAARGLGIIVGGPYNSGVLAGGTHYEYQPATQAMLDRVARTCDVDKPAPPTEDGVSCC